MYRPFLVTPPAELPVTLTEALDHLRRERDFNPPGHDEFINGLVAAATAHLDGWTGILGRCLVEQVWRQDYDRFAPCLKLPLPPVIAVISVKWRDQAGVETTIASTDYTLRTSAGGLSFVEFASGFTAPAGLADRAGVSVEFSAGYQTVGGVSTVPEPIKQAIKLLVGAWDENREDTAIGVSVAELPRSVAADALLAPWRRVRI